MLAFLFSRGGLAFIGMALVAGVIGVQTLRLNHAKSELASLRAADAMAAAQARVTAANAAKISESARNTLDQRQAQIITKYKTLVQKVVQYVPAAADADCRIPVGFVRLHDAAASNLPAPAGGPEQAASGVPLSAVAATVAENYGIAYGWREEALIWRDWYAKQAANH